MPEEEIELTDVERYRGWAVRSYPEGAILYRATYGPTVRGVYHCTLETPEEPDEVPGLIETLQDFFAESRRSAAPVLPPPDSECTGANDGTCPKHPRVVI